MPRADALAARFADLDAETAAALEAAQALAQGEADAAEAARARIAELEASQAPA